jgi:hypothetical protein
MQMRTSLPNESEYAREVFRKYYAQIQSEFLTFFPEIIKFVVKEEGVTIALKDNRILD